MSALQDGLGHDLSVTHTNTMSSNINTRFWILVRIILGVVMVHFTRFSCCDVQSADSMFTSVNFLSDLGDSTEGDERWYSYGTRVGLMLKSSNYSWRNESCREKSYPTSFSRFTRLNFKGRTCLNLRRQGWNDHFSRCVMKITFSYFPFQFHPPRRA